MPMYAIPKGISKREVKNAPNFKFSAARMSIDHEAPDEIPCTRCAQSIAKGTQCDKHEKDDERCDVCKKGHRAQCTDVPPEFYGRVTALIESRRRFTTLTAGMRTRDIKHNAAAHAAGVKLARMQRSYTKAFLTKKRIAGRQGVQTGVPTARPRTTKDFLGLLLTESRRRNELLMEQNSILRGVRRAVDSDSDGGSDGDGGSGADDGEESEGGDDDEAGE